MRNYDMSKWKKKDYIPLEKKSTDYLYSAVSELIYLPIRYGSKQVKSILQGDVGSCTAVGCISTINSQEALDTGELFSEQYQYSKTKEIDGRPESEGSDLRSAASVPVNHGCLPRHLMEYVDEFPPRPTTPELDEIASLYKRDSYYYVGSIQEMKQAIVETGAVFVGAIVMESWYKFEGDVVPLPYGSILGGHAFKLDLYDDEIELTYPNGKITVGGFAFANSWDGFGNPDGYAWLSYQWILTKTDLGMSWFDFGYAFKDGIDNSTGVSKRQVQLDIGNEEYTVNGFEYVSDVVPMIKNNRTVVGVRFASEGLGYNVGWNPDIRQVIISDEKVTLTMIIDSDKYYVNGIEYTTDIPPFIENDRCFVGLRMISEGLGAEVNWRDLSDTITIIK